MFPFGETSEGMLLSRSNVASGSASSCSEYRFWKNNLVVFSISRKFVAFLQGNFFDIVPLYSRFGLAMKEGSIVIPSF